jgi:hypothetical protein
MNINETKSRDRDSGPVMVFVFGQNIARYRDLLKTEANKVNQQTLRKLLAEAEAGLAELEGALHPRRRNRGNALDCCLS